MPASTYERIATRKAPETRPEPGACTLDQLPAKSRAQVVRVESGHGTERQLAQLGIHAGATIRVVRCAPWGGPILVEVQGGTVAIGRGLARHVRVRLL